MALKLPKSPSPTVEVTPGPLRIRQSALSYAEHYAKVTNQSLDQVFSFALNKVLVPARTKKKKGGE